MAEMEASPYEAELKALMWLAYIVDAAAEGVLGKGAPAMMYQSGRDAGLSRGVPAVRTDDVELALRTAIAQGEEIWRFEHWNDPGGSGYWMESGGRRSAWFIFTRCPLMGLARAAGTAQGGILCHALHGYIAGCMERSLQTRVDMKINHCGPGACKILLEMRA